MIVNIISIVQLFPENFNQIWHLCGIPWRRPNKGERTVWIDGEEEDSSLSETTRSQQRTGMAGGDPQDNDG